MRVASVTTPFFIGTLRSTRTSTRLPDMSSGSIVLKVVCGMNSLDLSNGRLAFPDDEYQHIALARGGDKFVAGLAAEGGEVGLGGGIGGAYREQAADGKLAQLAVGAQHGKGQSNPVAS